jgi:hypothetical protein
MPVEDGSDRYYQEHYHRDQHPGEGRAETWEDLPYLVQYAGEDHLVAGSDWGDHGGHGLRSKAAAQHSHRNKVLLFQGAVGGGRCPSTA